MYLLLFKIVFQEDLVVMKLTTSFQDCFSRRPRCHEINFLAIITWMIQYMCWAIGPFRSSLKLAITINQLNFWIIKKLDISQCSKVLMFSHTALVFIYLKGCSYVILFTSFSKSHLLKLCRYLWNWMSF